MVQILKRPESTSDRFARAFANIGQALPEALEKYLPQKKANKPLSLKDISNVSKSIETFRPNAFNDEDKAKISQEYAKFKSENPDVDEIEALNHIIDKYSESLGGEGKSKKGKWEPVKKLSEHPHGLLGEFLEPALKTAKEHPSQLAKELPVAATKSLEGLAALHDPLGMTLKSLIPSERKPMEASDILAGAVRKGLPEEAQTGAERIAQTESFLLDMFGPSLGRRLFNMGKRGMGIAKALLSGEGAKAASAAEEVAGKGLAAAEEGIAGKLTKEAPETATELRMGRLEPEARLYKAPAEAALRETQVKEFPKYEAEIAEDAAARATRAEARVPKTAVGEMGQAKRVAMAQERLPEVQKGYHNAVARVRALENEMVALRGEARKALEPILDLAKKELNAAEFELQQAVANLKGESVRAGIPAMEKAAVDKMEKIAATIAEGETVNLAKMDYSPELIAQAKKISKAKKLPSTRTDDFYTQVHNTYADMYKRRLGQIENEMREAMNQKGLASLYRRRQLGQEQDALKKMIESAEAENTIHRHKLALREMAARKQAADRFAKLKPQEGGKKVSDVAEQKMWKQRIEEAKTLEAKEKVVEDAVEQIVKENPEAAAQIEKEGSGLKGALGKLEREAEALKHPTGVKGPKEVRTWVQKRVADFSRDVSELKTTFPNIWESKIGRDLITGVAGAVYDDIKKEYDLPISAGSLTTAFLGRQGSGILIRSIVNQISKKILTNIHVAKAEEAYKSRDMAKFNDYSKKIQKQAKQNLRLR